jgi:hypothetical protein
MYPSYIGGMFRSVRFGIESAHGGGNIIQFNFYREKGGITYDEKSGKFGVDTEKLKLAITELSKTLLAIQATGNYDLAKSFVNKYKVIRNDMKQALEGLNDIPIDIRPRFAVEKFVK